MAATRADIVQWFDERASDPRNTHMIVVCDDFDYEDYPVYVNVDEDVHKVHAKFDGKNMQRVIEVYNLLIDRETQLNEYRAKNF